MNPFARTTPQNSTPNLFNNSNQAPSTVNPMFSNNSQAPKTPSIFANPSSQTSGTSSIFPPTTQPSGTTTNTVNLLTSQKPNLFSQQLTTTTTTNLFNPFTNTSLPPNPFSNTSTNTGLAVGGAMTSTAPIGFFKSSITKPDGLTGEQQLQKQTVMSAIMNYAPGTLTNLYSGYIQLLKLPETNKLRNLKVKAIDNQNFKTLIITLLEKFVHISKTVPIIGKDQKLLLHILSVYQGLLQQKIKIYKQSYLQLMSFSNQISQIEETLDQVDALVMSQFKYCLQSLKQSQTISITRPTEFERQFTKIMLEQARKIFEEIRELGLCKGEGREEAGVSYVDVIEGIVEYFNNVNCLVWEFKQRQERAREGMVRSREDERNPSKKPRNMFSKLSEVERGIGQVSERLRTIKSRYEEEMERFNRNDQ